jgi:hypothetical protein
VQRNKGMAAEISDSFAVAIGRSILHICECSRLCANNIVEFTPCLCKKKATREKVVVRGATEEAVIVDNLTMPDLCLQ